MFSTAQSYPISDFTAIKRASKTHRVHTSACLPHIGAVTVLSIAGKGSVGVQLESLS